MTSTPSTTSIRSSPRRKTRRAISRTSAGERRARLEVHLGRAHELAGEMDAAVAAAQDPVNHRYTPAAGLPELREAVAGAPWLGRRLYAALFEALVQEGE